MPDWITLTCPLCGGVMGRATSESTAEIELLCDKRRCDGRPAVTFAIRDGRALRTSMVDRRQRRVVKSA